MVDYGPRTALDVGVELKRALIMSSYGKICVMGACAMGGGHD